MGAPALVGRALLVPTAASISGVATAPVSGKPPRPSFGAMPFPRRPEHAVARTARIGKLGVCGAAPQRARRRARRGCVRSPFGERRSRSRSQRLALHLVGGRLRWLHGHRPRVLRRTRAASGRERLPVVPEDRRECSPGSDQPRSVLGARPFRSSRAGSCRSPWTSRVRSRFPARSFVPMSFGTRRVPPFSIPRGCPSAPSRVTLRRRENRLLMHPVRASGGRDPCR